LLKKKKGYEHLSLVRSNQRLVKEEKKVMNIFHSLGQIKDLLKKKKGYEHLSLVRSNQRLVIEKKRLSTSFTG
jgi:hypothetical protein